MSLYETVPVINEFLDADERPYPLPKARALVAWQSRLWAADGTNIIYHCNNDNPHHWEPLNAIPFQSGQQADVTGLCPFGNRLMVSTPESLWQVTGDSPYNWQFQTVLNGNGAMNEHCMASDGQRLFHLDREGVFELGNPNPLSEPIEPMFNTADAGAQLLLEATGTYLYALVHGRLFVLHLRANHWGEIKPPAAIADTEQPFRGLVLVGGQVAFYGDGGLWLQGAKYAPDVDLAGNRNPVISTLRSWPSMPDPYGNSALNRVYLNIEGSYQSRHSWRSYYDEYSTASNEQTIDGIRTTPPELVIDAQRQEILYREHTERVFMDTQVGQSDYQFEYEIQSEGYGRVYSFEPSYQITERTV